MAIIAKRIAMAKVVSLPAWAWDCGKELIVIPFMAHCMTFAMRAGLSGMAISPAHMCKG